MGEAVRRSVNLMSGPSDPIMVTTLPDLPVEAGEPTVPVFNYHHEGDIYRSGMGLQQGIRILPGYGTADDRSGPQQAHDNAAGTGICHIYRVRGLRRGYYFWIQAEATSAAVRKSSLISATLYRKTVKRSRHTAGFGAKQDHKQHHL